MFIIPPLHRMLRRDAIVTQFVPSAIVFVVLMIFSILGWQNANQTLETQRVQAVSERVTSVEDSIGRRMQASGTLLRAGAGLFSGTDSVTHDQWNRFYSQFGIDERFVGVNTIGYAPVINVSDISDLEQEIRGSGVSGYRVNSTARSGNVVPLAYITQYEETPSIPYGFDMNEDENKREAMMLARDTGATAMSQYITLGDDEESDRGIVLFRPIYERGTSPGSISERREALTGYVLLWLDAQELFANSPFGNDENFGFIVTQNGADENKSAIFESTYGTGMSGTVEPVATTSFEQFGQSWTIDFYASPNMVAPAASARPQNILAAGLAITFIASVAVFLLIQYRTRMFGMVEEQKLQQAKDELLSLASHQLRTPATGVKQYVGMVLDGFGGPVPEEQTKLLEQAYKSNERQLQIINEFLYVAKLGSGSLTISKHVFDLAALVRDLTEEMMLDVQEKNHRLIVEVPEELQVKADEHSVRMIIENLISNAIKYTPDGGTIKVKLEKEAREVRVSIKDNGVGIAKRDQGLLFKQFSRVPNELSSEVSGSGIGLYLAHQLAVRNDGNITVKSDLARGATFTLRLPARRVKKITNLANHT